MSLITILSIIIGCLIFTSIVNIIYDNRKDLNFFWSIWKRFRIKMFFEDFGVIILTLSSGLLLYKYIPPLRLGWLALIWKTPGSVLSLTFSQGAQSTVIWIRLLMPTMLLILIFSLPFFAKIEEEIFRKGHYKWGKIIRQSIKFGMLHLIIGIPIAFAIAISGTGFFYGCKYRSAFKKFRNVMPWKSAEEEAILVSATHHTFFNTILFGFLFTISLIAVLIGL